MITKIEGSSKKNAWMSSYAKQPVEAKDSWSRIEDSERAKQNQEWGFSV